VDDLANAIVKLGANPTLRERLGEAARGVAQSFSEPHVTASWHEVLYGQIETAKKPVTSVAASRAADSGRYDSEPHNLDRGDPSRRAMRNEIRPDTRFRKGVFE